LRQDPDVILIGEMRDAPTVATALMAAETGHLVLSTLHTTDATETLSRIIEFFPPHEQRQVRLVLAGVLRGTVCQRLMTKKEAGRVVATEVMVVNRRVQQWIVDPASREDVQDIIADGDYYGMHTFDQSILELFKRGEIDLATARANASNPHDLAVTVRRLGLDESLTPAAAPSPPAAEPVLEPDLHDTLVTMAARIPPAVPSAPPPAAAPPPPAAAAPKRRPGFWSRFKRHPAVVVPKTKTEPSP
jgi:twitching motility protein PilT